PTEIERQVTKPIEDVVSSISGIEAITSYSEQGRSMVMIMFDIGEDIDVKAMDIRSQLDLIRQSLPEDAEDPVVIKFELSQFPVITLALFGPQDVNELYRVADEELVTLISQVPGVAEVKLSGGERREVQVLVEARKLRKHRVPIGAVALALRAANVEAPAGHITQPDRRYIIRATGRFERVEEIGQVRVPAPGGGILTVDDLGEVRDTYGEATTASRFNGEQTIILAIQAQTDANEVAVADRIKEVLP
ncbi:unnamed protein product, partial [marine sediment metagenome]